ncbi:hypothetical protein SEA_RONAN_160 [Mycobacterium phage Ronan]|uniref:Uncharacterized protein n=1 Tax=Mycobacterium phage Mangeria TaxID=2686471 RepID=A0A6B9M1C5_9CAUD|nr:hypothetical protein KHO61_gp166 [Mycobacterium phage Mangeria]AYD81908.1 hypothetical protein SEA_ROOTS515_166 [Mycobacterium phage Roots515]QAY09747.1 hypothetical protein SEA_CHARGIE21_162 [Mycobacterium phage Chargie21]QAY15579.1 hypothetical protein SEA_BASQUIAT_162 [Mycobacterium phage Basquiat]QKO02238.1 hypothetical protein SEA_RONAN_160 [Mycobacterium phage Ronan]QPL13488.1 hypothetical protein SEA_STEPHANIEG_162 [Mycobacterium phage StephanieG]UTQ77954.1 hypothetical protein [Myc
MLYQLSYDGGAAGETSQPSRLRVMSPVCLPSTTIPARVTDEDLTFVKPLG